MGLFASAMHKSARKQIGAEIDHFKTGGPDARAGTLYYLWLTRGLNLVSGNLAETLNYPIYYYLRGAESQIISVMEALRGKVHNGLITALQLHTHTNLAVSYPDKGYSPLVRELWRTLLKNHTDLAEPVNDLREERASEEIQHIIKNNDISEEDLIAKPSSITPHFLVPGHPLSAKLLEDEKLGRYIAENG